MAWQGERASTAQIAAKAVLKPVGRYRVSVAPSYLKSPSSALKAFLGRPAPLFKQRETAHRPAPRLNIIGRYIQSYLMIAENLASPRRITGELKIGQFRRVAR
jgi:hypothetical protein